MLRLQITGVALLLVAVSNLFQEGQIGTVDKVILSAAESGEVWGGCQYLAAHTSPDCDVKPSCKESWLPFNTTCSGNCDTCPSVRVPNIVLG